MEDCVINQDNIRINVKALKKLEIKCVFIVHAVMQDILWIQMIFAKNAWLFIALRVQLIL